MKLIVILFMLFVPTDLVLANQSSNNTACSEMYRTYMNAYDVGGSISKEQMLYFHNTCVSSNAVNNDEPLHRKLLQRMDYIERIITVQT